MMNFYGLLTIFVTLCGPQLIVAKSDSLILHDPKSRLSQNLNAVSTTAKPELQYDFFRRVQNPNFNLPHISQHLRPVTQPFLLQQQQQQTLQPLAQQQLMQMIHRAVSVSQQLNRPAAMLLIIAQPPGQGANPAYYGQQIPPVLQQNYPQTRYQVGPAAEYHHQEQPLQQIVTPSAANFIPNSVAYQPNVVAPASNNEKQTSLQLAEIAQLAQTAAQQYQIPLTDENQAPVKSLPPIITGFENFSPEQQEKIKARLSAHFGVPLQPLQPTNQLQNNAYGNNNNYHTVNTRLNSNEYVQKQEVENNNDNSAKSSYTQNV